MASVETNSHNIQDESLYTDAKLMDNHETDTALSFDENQNPTFQKGILKYYRKTDYFLNGGAPNNIAEQLDEKQLQLIKNSEKDVKQGTFYGVWAPVMQNIFGVLLFIRVPSITGEAGIIEAFLISLICCITTFLTVLSLSAIATNGRIFKGGTYYLISRSMGAPIGSAIGICFYLGTTFGAGMYILGASESFIRATGLEIGGLDVSMRVYGVILLAFVTLINLVGLKYVAKTDLVFLGIVLLAIFSIYLGFFINNDKSYESGDFPKLEDKYRYAPGIVGISSIKDNWENNKYSRYVDNSFFVLLSIYSPAVTGIMAGANRSGNLIDPSKSLPKGTLTAQLMTSAVYITAPILFGLVCDRNLLQTEKYIVAAEISWPTKYFTMIAIILSSLGSGLQSIVGAPKILEAIAEDDNLAFLKIKKEKIKKFIFPLTILICFGVVMIGDINAINPVITMFFLICYGFVNLCCFSLDLIQFPSWRPTFKFYNKYLSLLGFLVCFFLMIAISWYFFLIAIFIIAILFTVIYRQQNQKDNVNYGDFIDSVRLISAKFSLFGLVNSKKHVKNWIPIVLVVGGCDPSKDHDQQIGAKGALFFLETIKQDISFSVYGNYIYGNYTIQDLQQKKAQEQTINAWMKKEKIRIINKTVMYQKLKAPQEIEKKYKDEIQSQMNKQPHQGMLFLIQGAGLGGLEPNTIVTNFPHDFRFSQEKAENFVQFVAYGVRMDKAVIITVNDENFTPKMETIKDKDNNETFKRLKQQPYTKSIDIWSFSYENGLMILMSYFLNRSKYWEKCPINIFILALNIINDIEKTEEEKRIKDLVVTFLKKYRFYNKEININVEVIQTSEWKQIEGFLLTEGKKDQLEKYPEKFNSVPVDSTYNYGMDLNGSLDAKSVVSLKANEYKSEVAKEKLINQQELDNFEVNGIQKKNKPETHNMLQKNSLKQNKKPSRGLSVMSQTQVSLFNKNIVKKSQEADLVIMNLPEPVNQQASDYLQYLANMTQGLKRVLLVRNTKQQCITEYT